MIQDLKKTIRMSFPTKHELEIGAIIGATSFEARVKIRQTTGTLVNKGFCEVSPILFYAGRDLDFGHRNLMIMNDGILLTACS